jgi:thymidylate synthase
MHILKVRNVHAALPEGISLLCRNGYERDSRYGRVIKMDGPVVTEYGNPWERVIFGEERDFNPFLNLFEAIYLLAGRDDVFFLSQYAKKMKEFSDDGKTFHGSYGRRWRSWFKIDQIQIIIDELSANKDNRRCVLQMWDATRDLGKKGVDFPCNTHVYFSINRENELEMTVCNRSNDILFGAYNTNAVCFSILQEYIAMGIGVSMGKYWQMSNDYHAYLNVFTPLTPLADRCADPYRVQYNPYMTESIESTRIVDTPIKEWTEDLHMWFSDPYKVGIRSKFFKKVATPMYAAHKAHKKGETAEAIKIIDNQMDLRFDWAIASKEWLTRRLK